MGAAQVIDAQPFQERDVLDHARVGLEEAGLRIVLVTVDAAQIIGPAVEIKRRVRVSNFRKPDLKRLLLRAARPGNRQGQP